MIKIILNIDSNETLSVKELFYYRWWTNRKNKDKDTVRQLKRKCRFQNYGEIFFNDNELHIYYWYDESRKDGLYYREIIIPFKKIQTFRVEE